MFKSLKYLAIAAAALPFVALGNPASAQDLVVGAAGNPGGLAVFVAQEKGLGYMSLERWSQLRQQMVEASLIDADAAPAQAAFDAQFLPAK